MRYQDLLKLKRQHEYHMRGGLPDLGQPHVKAGYRFAIGYILKDGIRVPARFNLGRDKLRAQYAARALFDLWLGSHEQGYEVPEAEHTVLPADARERAFTKADDQLGHAGRIAADFNAGQRGDFPYAPTMKLVAVPVTVPDAEAAKYAVDSCTQSNSSAASSATTDSHPDSSKQRSASAIALEATTSIDRFLRFLFLVSRPLRKKSSENSLTEPITKSAKHPPSFWRKERK